MPRKLVSLTAGGRYADIFTSLGEIIHQAATVDGVMGFGQSRPCICSTPQSDQPLPGDIEQLWSVVLRISILMHHHLADVLVSVCLCMCLCVCVSVCLCVWVWYYGLADYDASPPMWLHANYPNWISTSAVCLFCLMARKPGMKHPRVIKEYNMLFTLSLIHGTHFCADHHFHQIRFSDLRLERHFQLTNLAFHSKQVNGSPEGSSQTCLISHSWGRGP